MSKNKCDKCEHRDTVLSVGSPCAECIHLYNVRKDNFIKAEPKVLTAEEYLISKHQPSLHNICKVSFDSFRDLLINFFEAGHQNGRLERDLELKTLIDAVSILYEKADHDGVSSITQKVLNAFRILPPLTPETK